MHTELGQIFKKDHYLGTAGQ